MPGDVQRWYRVRIRGVLECRSEMHIGDGDLKAFAGRYSEGIGEYNSVIVGIGDKPIIPGSTLKGVMLEGLDRAHGLGRDLYGNGGSNDEAGKASRVWVHDAVWTGGPDGNVNLPYWCNSRKTCIRHGIALDSVIGSVREGALFRYEMVPAGSRFELTIDADGLDKTEIKVILETLAEFNSNGAKTLGRGRSKGAGAVSWSCTSINGLSKAAITSWLENTDCSVQELDNQYCVIDGFDNLKNRTFNHCAMQVTLLPLGPLLVNEPGLIQSSGTNNPKQEYARTQDGRALVPASTFMGALRGRAHRILSTITHQFYGVPATQAAQLVAPMIDSVFGGERFRSIVWCTEALSREVIGEDQEHLQTFIARDRFSGKVKDGALFSVRASVPEALDTRISLDVNRLPRGNWWKGLLILLARDAIEGLLAVGSGKGRGYGVFRLSMMHKDIEINSWRKLLDLFGKDNVETWIASLHEKVKEQTDG